MATDVPLLRLFQILDSGFPTGGYTLSHGLEGLHARGLLRSAQDVSDFVDVHLHETLRALELPIGAYAYRLASSGDVDQIVVLDEVLGAYKPVQAFHTGSIRVGRRLLESYSEISATSSFYDAVHSVVRDRTDVGHQAVVWALVCHDIGLPEDLALLSYAATNVAGYVAASVRLGVIGQQAAQQIIASKHEVLSGIVALAQATDLDDIGGYSPAIDLAGMRQDRLTGRLFAS